MSNDRYREFISRKSQLEGMHGFEPLWMPDYLFGFQKYLVEWACRKGRAAVLADCGMGKSLMQLVWAENVRMKTGKPVLILTPLAVGYQMVAEAKRFGIDAERSGYGKHSSGIVVTNYERLRHFTPDDFGGVSCDEASILKNFDGFTKAAVIEFMRTIPYRLLCTATAAPNDYDELGNSSEALGYLGYQDMLSRFFKEDTVKDALGWGRTTYRFRGHAEEPFWRWVCSWARACRKPSDLGYEDGKFILPPLAEREVLVDESAPRPGYLFSMPAVGLKEQRQERRVTLEQRCELAASLATSHNRPCAVWGHLNDETDLLEELIPGARQVSGSMPEEQKEEILVAFQSGQLQRIVLKPKIGCFGLCWHHCSDIVTFPGNSWEQYYQLVRRCWRFGQKNTVNVSIVSSEGEQGVIANLRRKANAADRMFEALCRHVTQAMAIDHKRQFPHREEIPAWLSQSR